MKNLAESLLFRLGYLRESYRNSKEWYTKLKIQKQIENIETVLIDINVLTENQRSKLL